MSNSPWDEPVVVRGPTIAQPRRPQWPWEQPERIQRSSDFLREHICEVFLARVFDETARYMGGYGRGFNFVREDGATFIVRASRSTPRNGAWVCNFGRTDADFILFFGFRGRDDPILEFCLVLPLEIFRDRDRITILDDGYHIKGYREFWISDEKLAEMQTVMDAIRIQDSAALERYLPRPSR
jgi:hypothetical protein